MAEDPYWTRYSDDAKAAKKALSAEIQAALHQIDDSLAEDPEQFPNRTKSFSEEVFLYTHPEPEIQVTYKIDRKARTIEYVHIVAPKTQLKDLLYISFSQEDKEWLDLLKKYLVQLEKLDVATLWDHTQIEAGKNRLDEIKKALASAKAAILLVSQNFLFEEFVASDELPQLLEKAEQEGVKIFWIALSSSTVKDSHPKIFQYQPVNDPEEPLDAFEQSQKNKELAQIFTKIKEALAA